MPQFRAALDLNRFELSNARIQNLAAAPLTPVEGQIYQDTVTHVLNYYNGSAWVALVASVPITLFDANTILAANSDNTPLAVTVGEERMVGRITGGNITALTATEVRTFLGALNLFTAPTASLNLNSQTITSLASPVNATDAANRAYVDSVAAGLDIHASVRAATTANVNLAAPGATIDGVTLATGNRVLVKDQTAPAGETNGIYVFDTAATPMTRATDADANTEVTAGLFVFVEEGTDNHDKGFVLTTDNPIVVGTTDLTFTQFSGAGTVTGTADRITVTGGQVDIAATYAGQSSIVTLGTVTTGTWNGTDIAVADGGTGASTAADAKANLGFLTRYATLIGNASDTTLTITHNLNTRDVVVELYDAATYQTVYADVVRSSVNACTATFGAAPGTDAIRAVVVG